MSDIKTSFERHKNFAMLLSFFIIVIDIYFIYHDALVGLNWTHNMLDVAIVNIYKTGFLKNGITSKITIIILTGLFTLFDKGKKDLDLDKKTIILSIIISTIIFLLTSYIPKFIHSMFLYILILLVSFLYLIKTYSYFSRLLNTDIMKDRFNKKNKIFPQNIEIIENDMSVNIPYKFVENYDSKQRPVYNNGYINLIAPNRATMILGKPGSGKSYSFIEEIIRQHIMKAFSMINYDYKFPTLTNISYNYFKAYEEQYDIYENKAKFAVINLDNPVYSHRCNPVHKNLLQTKAQAVDAVYTLFFNIDKKSATKQDFFQMSAMSITSAALWFLRNFENGKFCSLPHLIEFINRSDSEILTILDSYPELRYFTSAFSDALAKESFDQLSGQTASARIPLGKLATDEMFWVMAPPEEVEQVDLRVNKKDNITILNIANNPDTQKTNGPALGLFMSQTAKLINAQGRAPCDFIVDELPTIFINGLNTLIATGRSNKVCAVLSIQDYTQIVNEYGKEQADTIFNTTDNIISGKVAIETAEKVSKGVGKINYQTQSVSISKDSTSTSFNTQREYLVPPEDISQFSQGEFVGIVSDTYKQPIELKAFRGLVSPDKSDLGNEELPEINPGLTKEDLKNYSKVIQKNVDSIIRVELERIEYEKQKDIEEAETFMEEENISIPGNDENEFIENQNVLYDHSSSSDESLEVETDQSQKTSFDEDKMKKIFEDLKESTEIDGENNNLNKDVEDQNNFDFLN